LGICRTAQWALAEPCSRVAVEAVGERLGRAGARVSDVALPEYFASLVEAQKTIMAYEAARNYVYETTRASHQLSDAFRALTDAGSRTSRESYVDAKRLVAAAKSELGSIVGDCDALITPAAVGEAPLAETGTGDPIMSRMWNALHVPSLAIPVTKGPHGLPVGVQLIAMCGADDRLLQVGRWASQALAA
jgi:Asp-tRNA(Asn)/Glu-tRNA(Gln) amidotransferase A subunit family amidase